MCKFLQKTPVKNGCVAHVKEALSVEGVKSVDVDLDSKKVKVESTLSIETLMNYVSEAGYQPTKV